MRRRIYVFCVFANDNQALHQARGHIEVYRTKDGSFVGWIEPPLALVRDPVEVAAIFEVPLAFLLDPANQQQHYRMQGARRRDYWAIPYGERYIWGATAAMLLILDRTLRDSD